MTPGVETTASTGRDPGSLGASDLRSVATDEYGDARARARYFGPVGRQLFGIFEEPALDANGIGVVLCYPQGGEYDTAFKTFRILGTRLARAGFRVLRFDYLGTGDSWGDEEDGSLAQWTTDTISAIREVRAARGIDRVAVIGLRLGATTALRAALESGEVDRAVLWAPVLDGERYLAEQRALHDRWMEDERRQGREPRAVSDELLGYRITPRLRAELQEQPLVSRLHRPGLQVQLLGNEVAGETDALRDLLREQGAIVEVAPAAGPSPWGRTPSMPDVAIPNRELQQIVTWLSRVDA